MTHEKQMEAITNAFISRLPSVHPRRRRTPLPLWGVYVILFLRQKISGETPLNSPGVQSECIVFFWKHCFYWKGSL